MKGLVVFPYFLQFKCEFCNTEFMIWAKVSSWCCFWWLYTASLSLALKNVINLISILTIWWHPFVESSLVLLEEGVCYDQCILLARLCESLLCFILYSKAKFACYSRYFLTSSFCIPFPGIKGIVSKSSESSDAPYDGKNIFFWCSSRMTFRSS